LAQICTDIAGTSVNQCEDRYKGLGRKTPRNMKVFDAEFIVNDSAKVMLGSEQQRPTKLCIFSLRDFGHLSHSCIETRPISVFSLYFQASAYDRKKQPAT